MTLRASAPKPMMQALMMPVLSAQRTLRHTGVIAFSMVPTMRFAPQSIVARILAAVSVGSERGTMRKRSQVQPHGRSGNRHVAAQP